MRIALDEYANHGKPEILVRRQHFGDRRFCEQIIYLAEDRINSERQIPHARNCEYVLISALEDPARPMDLDILEHKPPHFSERCPRD